MAEVTVTNASGGTTSGTLGWAINQASNGDTIIFNLGTNNTVTVSTSGGLYINKSIDIDGSNASGPEVIISGKKYRQLFSVSSGKTVQFSGMTMTAARMTSKQGGGAIDNKGTVAVSDVLFTGNTYSYGTNLTNGRGAGGLYNIKIATLNNVTFSGNTGIVGYAGNLASGGILNYSGTVTLTNVTFTGNIAVVNGSLVEGAAIRNVMGTVHIAGTVDLATESDTWVNGGTSTKKATVDWDLTGGTASYGTIKHFERYSNDGSYVEQTITVSAEQELGEYVIASGSLGSLASNVDDFTITGVSGQEDAAITVGGDSVTYNGLSYTLANVNNEQLVLTVETAGPSYDERIVVPGGSAVTLTEGKTYTAAPYAGCGGALYVSKGGTVTGNDVTLTGNTATYGGAIFNQGVIDFGTGTVTFTGNTASDGVSGAIDNYNGTINFAGSIDLATASDTWLNETYEGTATVNWIISGGTAAYASIKNFERYSNADGSDVKQTITVSATQETGDYVIATGDLADMTDKDTFYLTLDGTTLSDAFKVNTLGYLYSGRYYSLTRTDSALTLTVAASETPVAQTQALGGKDGKVAGGTYERMVLGGELQSGNHDYNGSYTLDVTGGTFASDFAGGDAANGDVTRTGSIAVNISGGTFTKSVTGGNYYAGTDANTASLIGNIDLNITGGTFFGRIYGGCGAMTDTLGAQSSLFGSVNLTINATSAIYVGECIAAGNRGNGSVTGSTNVTVTGLGGNLAFADNSVLFGGCSGDCYKVEKGVRTDAITQVEGSRKLTFDKFEGPFNAEIRMFSEISFVNNTSVDFADDALDLTEVGVWNFDCGSSVTSLKNNDFKGDTINIDTSDYDGTWSLISGEATAFTNFGEASLVTLGGNTATWDGSAWCTAEYQLYVEEDTLLTISELA